MKFFCHNLPQELNTNNNSNITKTIFAFEEIEKAYDFYYTFHNEGPMVFYEKIYQKIILIKIFKKLKNFI